MRHASPEIAFDAGQAKLQDRRHRKQQRCQTRIGVEFEPGDDQRHTQRMTPDGFTATQLAIAIDAAGEVYRPTQALCLDSG